MNKNNKDVNNRNILKRIFQIIGISKYVLFVAKFKIEKMHIAIPKRFSLLAVLELRKLLKRCIVSSFMEANNRKGCVYII